MENSIKTMTYKGKTIMQGEMFDERALRTFDNEVQTKILGNLFDVFRDIAVQALVSGETPCVWPFLEIIYDGDGKLIFAFRPKFGEEETKTELFIFFENGGHWKGELDFKYDDTVKMDKEAVKFMSIASYLRKKIKEDYIYNKK